jgi:prolyl-tRNA synthetase
MGCYGIGVSRLAQAAVEQHHDGQGICWPVSIAPYEVVVVPANNDDPTQAQLAEQLYSELEEAGVEVLFDDRSERAGVKFKDADLIGIPWRVVVGRGAAGGQIELVERQGNRRQDLASADLLPVLLPRLVQDRRGLPEQPT